jgi:hypothetical protein
MSGKKKKAPAGGGDGAGVVATGAGKSKLADLLKMTVQITTSNFTQYKNCMKNAVYFANWPDELVDLDQKAIATLWDFKEDNDSEEEKTRRREAYTLVYEQISEQRWD